MRFIYCWQAQRIEHMSVNIAWRKQTYFLKILVSHVSLENIIVTLCLGNWSAFRLPRVKGGDDWESSCSCLPTPALPGGRSVLPFSDEVATSVKLLGYSCFRWCSRLHWINEGGSQLHYGKVTGDVLFWTALLCHLLAPHVLLFYVSRLYFHWSCQC